MTYIIVAAGMGTRLRPHTLAYPKSLFKLDADTTLLGRLVFGIRAADKTAEIVVCAGFCADKLERELPGVVIVKNPFYAVTNSLATLWFAREYLDRDNVVLIDGDVVVEQRLIADVYAAPTDKPTALIDTSRASGGDYCVQLGADGLVVAMSKDLTAPDGEYANVTKLDRASALCYRDRVIKMIDAGQSDQWMETALAQMIFEDGFELHHQDIAGYAWSEVDGVSDLARAREIHREDGGK